jgi:hypothetical protein
MPATADVRTIAVGGQRLRVAIRKTKGPNGPGQPPRYPLLLVNGIGGLAPVVDGFLAAPEVREMA